MSESPNDAQPAEVSAETSQINNQPSSGGDRDVELGHMSDDANVPKPLQTEDTKAVQPEESSKEAKRWILGRALGGEFLATFLFMFINMAVPFNMYRLHLSDPVNVPLNPNTEAVAVSFIAVAVIYSFADISGAHFNPAVTFATVVTGKMTWKKGAAYVAAQLLGAVWASFWFIMAFPDGIDRMRDLALVPPENVGTGYQLVMEFTLTFFLVYVIFSVAFDTVDSTKVEVKQVGLDAENGAKNVNARNLTIYTTSGDTKSGFAPIAIGFTLGMLSLVGGSVSGGAYNPARAFGPAMCSGIWRGQWIVWIGDLAGAAAAGWTQLFFQKLRKLAGSK